MIQILELPGHTARLNQLMGRNRFVIHRIKKADREFVGLVARMAGLTPAEGKRRVSLVVTLGPRQRAADEDAWEKSLLDGMVACGLLKDDSPRWVEFVRPVQYRRGAKSAMTITFEDL